MVVHSDVPAADVSRLFQALADTTRRDILERVMGAEASVTELASRYDMSFAAVQKHVAILERANLVTKRRDGRAQRVAGNPDAIRRAARLLDQLEQIWLARVNQLDALLATPSSGETNARHRHTEGPVHPHDDRGRSVRGARRARVGRLD
ncbi:MAG: metalloregulator ArsR/SmtB family transcription factor [Vicinamibacterales bacterium]